MNRKCLRCNETIDGDEWVVHKRCMEVYKSYKKAKQINKIKEEVKQGNLKEILNISNEARDVKTEK
jgi:hypothetical protein